MTRTMLHRNHYLSISWQKLLAPHAIFMRYEEDEHTQIELHTHVSMPNLLSTYVKDLENPYSLLKRQKLLRIKFKAQIAQPT